MTSTTDNSADATTTIDSFDAPRFARPMWWLIASSIAALGVLLCLVSLRFAPSFPLAYEAYNLLLYAHSPVHAALVISLWSVLRRVASLPGVAIRDNDRQLARLFLAALIVRVITPWLLDILDADVSMQQLANLLFVAAMTVGSFGVLRHANEFDRKLLGRSEGRPVLRTIHRCWIVWWVWMILLYLFGLYFHRRFGNTPNFDNPAIQRLLFWWQLAWIPYLFVLVPAVWSMVELRAFYKRIRRAIEGVACPACGYDLRGDYPNGCPECGWGRETRLVE